MYAFPLGSSATVGLPGTVQKRATMSADRGELKDVTIMTPSACSTVQVTYDESICCSNPTSRFCSLLWQRLQSHVRQGGDVALYLFGISPTHFASYPHQFASFPHQICFVSPKKCFSSPTVFCISPTKCLISPTVCCISQCNVVSRCQKIFFLIFGAKFYFKCVK